MSTAPNPLVTNTPGPNNLTANQSGTVAAAPTSGAGPQFDPNYRNNLAVFMGGLSMRPTGGLYLNPTAGINQDPWNGQGSPTTGGNSPLTGMPWQQFDWAQSLAQPATFNGGDSPNPFAT